MLASLQEAAAALEDAGNGAPSASAAAPQPETQDSPATSEGTSATSADAAGDGAEAAVAATHEAAPPAAKRVDAKLWKRVLPVAACLAIVAVGFGVVMGVSRGGSVSEVTVEQAVSGQSGAAASASAAAPAANRDAEAAAAPEAKNELMADDLDAQNYATTAEAGAVEDTGWIEPQPPSNTEEYAAIDENGFVSTRTRPLSTVSADVDTASYANVRRMVAQGQGIEGIPSGAVRTEEMLNYFTYDYAAPSGGDLFGMQAAAGTCPWNPDTQLLVLGFATAPENKPANAGANLVFLIDVSGSMSSLDKLELLKDSFATLLESLDARDKVSIVTYSGQEQVVLDGAAGDDDARILKAIYGLQASGSTNGEAGLRMAYEVAQRNFIEGGVNRIVMASDGDLNVGMTSESDLYDFVDAKRDSGVYLSVLGFGAGNYKDTKMEVLADHGNGSYHYIDCIDEAERVLSERLMANLVPFADDVKVQVEFNPSQVKAYRLIGYENRALADEDFANDAVDAGDVGPSAQFTVAYELVLADSAYEVREAPELKYGSGNYAGSGSRDWLTCSLRYRAFADNAVHEQSLVVDERTRSASPSADWTFAAAVVEFGMLAGHSSYVGSATMDTVLSLLGDLQLSEERQGFRDLVEQARDNSRHVSIDDPEPTEGTSSRNGFNRDPL
ncbi:MAG TPA: VWA domain-containing protein [Eggerthellaceae bacterium]|nr:VWA domain-containing protein [Eggerthellaceae bacterium]